MRRWSSIALVSWFVLAACGTVAAQSLKDSRFTDPATLIQNKKVQQHLDLDAATVQKVFQVPIRVREGALAEFKALANVKDPAEHERQKQDLKKKTIKAGIDELAKVLEPGDFERLQQIALQMSDYQAFTTKDVKAKLGLTPEQDDQTKSIVDVANKDVRDLIAGANVSAGDMEAMWKASKPARKRAMENVVAVLTPDQRKTWEAMVGLEFDFALDRPGKDLLPRSGGPLPATDAEKADPVWVAKRIEELMPKPTEKNFDQIGWITELREATKLAKEHNRGVFVMVVDGVAGRGRC